MNQGYDYSERIGREFAGWSVLEYLSANYPHSSRGVWRDRILAGRILLDGQVAGEGTVLCSGGVLTWERPPWVEPPVPSGLGVLYEDDHLLAVEKPCGLPTLPGGGFLDHTLLARVRARYPEAVPAHRLGRWTSGVVLFARTAQARSHLAGELRARRVWKRYRALASGRPHAQTWMVEVPIGPVPHALLGTVEAANPRGRSARSEVTVLRKGVESFLADVVIHSGRPHQIRIHLAASGYPLVGDPLYLEGGVPLPEAIALPGDPGYRLHAAEIRFCPRPGAPELRVTCPPPVDLRI